MNIKTVECFEHGGVSFIILENKGTPLRKSGQSLFIAIFWSGNHYK